MDSNNELETKLQMDGGSETDSGSAEAVPTPGHSNAEICPNCLEPNPDGLAVCRYCGMPLHPGAETDLAGVQEDEAALAAAREKAAPETRKDEDKKKPQESGFRRVMPWLGLYIIYYAITGFIETSRQKDLENPRLAYASWGIYLIAGVLMAWPMIKKGWNKIHPAPAQPEEEDVPEEETDIETEEAAEEVQPAEDESVSPEEVMEEYSEDEPEQDEAFSVDEPVSLPDFGTSADEDQAEDGDGRPEA